MKFNVTFSNPRFRGDTNLIVIANTGQDIISKAYFILRKILLKGILEVEDVEIFDNPVRIIQHIIDMDIYSGVFMKELVDNHNLYTIEEVVEKLAPIIIVKNEWILSSIIPQ
jgi:hypothetical protein